MGAVREWNMSMVSPMAEPIRLHRVVASARRGRLQLRPDMSWPAGTARVSALPYRIALSGRQTVTGELPRVRRRARMTTIVGVTAARRRLAHVMGNRRRQGDPGEARTVP